MLHQIYHQQDNRPLGQRAAFLEQLESLEHYTCHSSQTLSRNSDFGAEIVLSFPKHDRGYCGDLV